MAEDLPDRGAVVRHRSGIVGDLAVERQAPIFHAPEHERGGEWLSEIADRVCGVGSTECELRGWRTRALVPDDDTILDEKAGETRDLRLLPEQLDVALERRGRPVERGPRALRPRQSP